MTVAATGTGHLLILAYIDNDTISQSITSISGGGTWVRPSCRGDNSADSRFTNLSYVLSSTSGATTLSITLAQNWDTSMALLFIEYSGGTFTADGACQALSNQTASITPLSPAITTTGAYDLIVTLVEQSGINYASSQAVSNVQGSGWTTPYVAGITGAAPANPYDDNCGGICGTNSGVTPGTYQAGFAGYISAAYGSVAMAFSVSSGATACVNLIALMGAGCK